MTTDVPRMPDPIENDSMIPSLDRQGAIWLYIDEVTKAYLDFVPGKAALEIAAGYGHVVINALDHGAREVFANEIDAGQLAIIQSRTPAKYRDKLICCLGQFPESLDFAESSFDAVYNARLLHFFDGERVTLSLEKIDRWLKPGGKLFLVNDAIYRTVFKQMIPIYESRVAAGEMWPGFIEDVRSCIPEHLHRENFPKSMNFLDPAVLARELNRAGLEVEAAAFYPYTGNFALGRLDGREIAGAIARKL
ncbi:MAG TPA: class I SAM-dependent methyltransferase [Candidatus Binatia bacterium]